MPPTRRGRARVVERLAGELFANPLIEAYDDRARSEAPRRRRRSPRRRDERPRRRRRLPRLQLRSRRAPRARLAGAEPVTLWHESPDLAGVDAVVLPGGFAYGDYLRAGRHRPLQPGHARGAGASPRDGGLVLGICNGFQVLAEAGLVPGALLRNRSLRFEHRWVRVAAERRDTPFTRAVGERRPLRMPIAHGEGCYFADAATLDALERDGQVLFRYVDPTAPAARGDRNPNGSLRAIAGVMNAGRQVAGLMPHPERAAEASWARTTGCCAPLARGERPARAPARPAVRPSPEAADERPSAQRARAVPLHRALGVTDEELDAIVAKLGRAPERPRARHVQRDVERALLVQEQPAAAADAAHRRRRTWSPGPARTPACCAIGDGLAVAFKIESHNHPSAVEPYQGAATGVGRHPARHLHDGRPADRGARRAEVRRPRRRPDPPPRERRGARRRRLRQLRRRAHDRRRAGLRPLVPGQPARQRDGDRAAREDRDSRWPPRPGPATSSSSSARTTGRDGIGGASVLASATFGDDDPSKRPTVQVGDPFAEKLLIEASLELIERGLVEGAPGPGRGRHHLRDLARRPTGPGPGSSSTSTPSRAASRAWRPSR